MKYIIESSCKSHPGRVRSNNEDNYYYNFKNLKEDNNGSDLKTFNFKNTDHIINAVFDGMGGETNGEKASFLASQFLKEYINSNSNSEFSWEEYIEESNKKVLSETPKGTIMGTTVAAIFFSDDKISICNLGDSRIYGYKNGNLKQISKDHTTEEMNKKLGIDIPLRLTQHLGISEKEIKLKPYTNNISYTEFDKIIICSDGLTDMLTDNEIEEIIKGNNSQINVNNLVDKALEKGGKDNITVMVFEIKKDKKKRKTFLTISLLSFILFVILIYIYLNQFRIIKDEYTSSITVGESYELKFNKGEINISNNNIKYEDGIITAEKEGITIITIKDKKGKILYEKQIKIFP